MYIVGVVLSLYTGKQATEDSIQKTGHYITLQLKKLS